MTKSQKILSLLKKGKDIKEIAKIVRAKLVASAFAGVEPWPIVWR